MATTFLQRWLGIAVFGAGGFMIVKGVIGLFPELTSMQMILWGSALLFLGGYILKEFFGIEVNG